MTGTYNISTRFEDAPLLKDAERARVDNLLQQVRQWNRSKQIKEYVEPARTFVRNRDVEITEGSEVETWLAWANAQAERFDPLCQSPYSVLDEPETVE